MIIRPNIKLYSIYYFPSPKGKTMLPPKIIGHHFTKKNIKQLGIIGNVNFIIKEEI